MIIHEHIKKINAVEWVFIVALSCVIAGILFLFDFVLSPVIGFIASIGLIVLGMNLLVYVTKKFGVATLFLLIISAITFPLDTFGVSGLLKPVVFVIAGVVFEFMFLYFKVHIHNIAFDMILGTSIVFALVPFLGAFFISSGLASSFPLELLNLVLLSTSIALGSSVLVWLIWHYIENTKWVLKLQAYLLDLEK